MTRKTASRSTEPQDVSAFELSLFSMTRRLFAVVAIGALVGIGLCVLFFLGVFDKSTAVSYSEVRLELLRRATSGDQEAFKLDEKTSSSGTLPANLRPYFSSGANREILEAWLAQIPSESQRKTFLTELSRVVAEGVADGKEATDVINAFKTLKLSKIGASPFERSEATITRVGVGGLLFGLLFLLVNLALALVLMAIERHGRQTVERLSALGTGKVHPEFTV